MSNYKVFAIDKHGEKKEIDADSIMIELAEDKCLELDLNPHPNHVGGLPISAHPNPETLAQTGKQVHSMFNIKPGASNVVHLHIENIEIKDL